MLILKNSLGDWKSKNVSNINCIYASWQEIKKTRAFLKQVRLVKTIIFHKPKLLKRLKMIC